MLVTWFDQGFVQESIFWEHSGYVIIIKFETCVSESLFKTRIQTCNCIIIKNSHFRLLNSNELEGQVPEKLYSVGVHGGAIE